MNRRSFVRASLLTAASAALSGCNSSGSGARVGRFSYARWDKLNADAATKLDAIRAAAGNISADATSWLLRLAADSLRHLEVSRLLIYRGSDPDVVAYAKGEADEHVHLGAKLKEIAAAKNVALPVDWDDLTTSVVTMFARFGTEELHRT